MRRKMFRTAGTLFLSFVLSLGMSGCAGKGDGEPATLDIQSATLHDSDGTGSNSEPDLPDSYERKDSGEVESNNETGNSASVEGNTESVYFEGADLNGRVLEFSDTGFTITPIY
ncbi:MAG: hypothetical protein K2J04_09405, partial [Lachnospiraceae bacterium]|nr:hypothetical protein [Lachnospiraceae bacterium]